MRLVGPPRPPLPLPLLRRRCPLSLIVLLAASTTTTSFFHRHPPTPTTTTIITMMSSSSPATTITSTRRGFLSFLTTTSFLLLGKPVVSATETTKPASSSMGYDLTPLSENEVLRLVEKKGLGPLAQRVLLDAGTEVPFTGETANGYHYYTKEEGVWVSAVSGVPLFSSADKYDSGTGWPSFSDVIDPAHVIERPDPRDLANPLKPKFLQRVEVLDRKSGTHLGHVFDDGPAPTGKRYCMNTAAMEFVPLDKFNSKVAHKDRADREL